MRWLVRVEESLFLPDDDEEMPAPHGQQVVIDTDGDAMLTCSGCGHGWWLTLMYEDICLN